MTTRVARCVGIVAALCGVVPLGVRADVVISHPSVDLSAEEVRLVFLGEKQLAGGLRLVPVDNRSIRRRFLEKVLQTDERKYEARWLRKAFREGLIPPPTKGGDAEVIAFVRATPGAIGYVEKPVPDLKVLESY